MQKPLPVPADIHETLAAAPPDQEAEPARDLWRERLAIVGNTNTALEAIPAGSSTVIEHIGTKDGKSLGVAITHDHESLTSISPRSGDRNGFEVLTIHGTVSSADDQGPATFPMYRVTRTVPATDIANLRPHYEISAADPDGQDGYKPVALVMQSILGTPEKPVFEGSHKIGGYSELFKESLDQLLPPELAELRETGLYFNPDAQAQFDQVQTIMELVAAQAKANPNQPTLPLDFVATA